MATTYFKRYRMQIELGGRRLPQPQLDSPYSLIPWDHSLLEAHAEAKFHSFQTELDSQVFPCLGEREGCLRLMSEIVQKDGFLKEATWLAIRHEEDTEHLEFCGTVQGIRARRRLGAIQNLGITPWHRDRGIGTALLLASLAGFRRLGMRRVYLEVTAENRGAIRLYQRFGFHRIRTVYKAAELAYS